MTLLARLAAAYRRSGADLPNGDPRPSHGAEMEGYFWRITDVANRRVLVVLCGVNGHPDGGWATIAVAAHPGRFVRSAVVSSAEAATHQFAVTAGDGTFMAGEAHLHADLGEDARVELVLGDHVGWPLALGGGGMFSAVPFLGQYWHPHLLGGLARGTARLGHDHWVIYGADVYAEKNWGDGFPERWWWGQAHGFNRGDVCVAFSGGVLTAGPLAATVGGAVIRLGADVIRFTPPLAAVRTSVTGDRWHVEARRRGYRLQLEGVANSHPHVLPVPIPSERRNVDTDFEHLAGRLTVELSGRIHYTDRSELAGLEVGHRPA